MKKLLFLLALLFFLNCNFKKEKRHFILIEQVHWLLGNWTNQMKEGDLTETWEKLSDSTYMGESYILNKTDTVFHENIVLEQRNDSLFYTVSIKNQEPTVFYATKINSKAIEFSNPEHDFPTCIRYKLVTKDSILASIHGKINHKTASQEFPMCRAN